MAQGGPRVYVPIDDSTASLAPQSYISMLVQEMYHGPMLSTELLAANSAFPGAKTELDERQCIVGRFMFTFLRFFRTRVAFHI